MKVSFEDVYCWASCEDHPISNVLTEAEIKEVETLAAFSRCGCSEYEDPDWCVGVCDSESFALGQLQDGRYAVVWEASDTTGHGCICDGSASVFETLETALSLGLIKDQRELAIKTIQENQRK